MQLHWRSFFSRAMGGSSFHLILSSNFSFDKICPSIFTLSIYTWCEKASGALVGSVGT